MKNTIIKPSGEVSPYEPSNGKTYTLKELQQAVGGYIEVVPSVDGKQLFVVNENGYLEGLSYNAKATQLYNLNSIYSGGRLVGNVLIIEASTLE